ncbi:MAG: PilZ domain-containing protein [Candidatus Gygaella obscura]|nr:PilZ domain-containing protein [Candidatus Gygaella obscura]
MNDNSNDDSKRQTPRTPGTFIVTYKNSSLADSEIDVSQTKNIGRGGMLLSTTKQLEQGTVLTLEVRLPFNKEPIHFMAEVLDSKEVIRGLSYDTRLKFVNMDESQKQSLEITLNNYLNTGGK